MTDCNRASRALPFLRDFSAEDRRLAETEFDCQEKRRSALEDERAKKAEDLLADLRLQLFGVLGEKKLARLREVMTREGLVFRDLWQPPVDLNLDFKEQNRARRLRLDALLCELGASPEELRKIGADSSEKLRAILSATDGTVAPGYHLSAHLDRWNRLSALHRFPLPWGTLPPLEDPTDPHRWFLFRPPFFGFLFRFAPQASDNFRVDRELILNPGAGQVGNIATMDCGDAGGFDYASVTAESQVAFGFVPPATGLIEVLIDAQSTVGTHDLRMEDEWGWSESWTNQNNYLMMNVLHPNVPEPSLALMSNFRGEFDGDNSTQHRENLFRGQHYFAQLFSSGPVPAGQSVVVTVGTRTFDKSYANDVEVHSRTDFQWFINSVEVRVAP